MFNQAVKIAITGHNDRLVIVRPFDHRMQNQFGINIAGLMFDAIEKRLRVSKSGT